MMYDVEKAKHLLNNTSCYECHHYGNHCYSAMNNKLPETLHCKDFKIKKEIDAEAELLKSFTEAMEKSFDNTIIEKTNEYYKNLNKLHT